MQITLLPDRLLAAFYLKSAKDGALHWPVAQVAQECGFELSPGIDTMVAEQLAANGWLRLFVSDPPEEKAYAKITWEGIRAAEQILESRPE